MIYYTKNGSIPYPFTDGTEGWQVAPSPPEEIPAGKQLVWENWEWIIRDPKPMDREGHQWNWRHDTREWIECECLPHFTSNITEQTAALTTAQIASFTTDQIVLL
jgi:hypothetical protein